MTHANTFAAKLSVAFVATAMLFTLAAPAKAQTTEELQKMINDLLAQVASLQGQVGQGGTSVASGICPFTWTRSLSSGSTGADVMKLQQFLNADAETRVAASGAGSVGMETQFFGPATAAAVSKFQTKYRADILTPAGLVNPTGYFGPSSMAKANAICVTGTTPTTPGDDDNDDDDSSDVELSGEASLDNVEVADGEDDEIEEGQEAAPVAEITLEFADGDAMVTRLDIALDATTDGNDEVDPWDVFEEVSLWVDGDEIASMAADDEDDYLDEDYGTLRFSGLDIVAMEDEEVVVVVAVTVQNSVDGTSDGSDWEIAATGLRFVDADDVTTTETTAFGLQAAASSYSADTAEFTIEEAGAGDDLDLASSPDEPDARTLALDTDDNVEEDIFAFELDADDSDGDIELDRITIDIEISSTTGAIDDLVNDFRIEIDGKSFDAESFDGSGDTAAVDFDIDGDVEIEAGEVVTVVVFADFENMESDSDYQGVTITASVDTADIRAEGVEDITVGGNAQDGKAQTLRSEGIAVDYSDDSDTSKSGNTLTFEFEVDVTAFGDEAVIEKADFDFATTGPGGATPTISTSLSATGDVDEDPVGTFTVEENGTATFKFKVFVTTLDAGDAGLYRVTLEDIDGTEVDEYLEDVANFSS